MKKAVLAGILAASVLATGCSSMKEVEERKTYAQPSWYIDCAQAGTEGWFWFAKDMRMLVVQANRFTLKPQKNKCMQSL